MTGLGIGSFVVGFALNAGPLKDFPMVANPYGIDTSLNYSRRDLKRGSLLLYTV
jgi:hypothetical protein